VYDTLGNASEWVLDRYYDKTIRSQPRSERLMSLWRATLPL
jgi:hypothetical protein